MNENENPINEAPRVTVYLWEYARLVANSAKLNIVEDMVKKLDNYDLKKFLTVLFDREDLQD
jgi:hypothetical protein